MSVGTERNPESDDQFEMWRHSENQKNKPENKSANVIQKYSTITKGAFQKSGLADQTGQLKMKY